jgi:hypothetical protein
MVKFSCMANYPNVELLSPSGIKIFIESKYNFDRISKEQLLSESGTYTIVVFSNSNRDNETINFGLSQITPTDVRTLQQGREYAVNIAPNPNNGFFTVTTTFEGENQLIVTTLSGQLIYGPVSFNKSTQVNLTSQTIGIYICVVKNSNQFKTQKISIH